MGKDPGKWIKTLFSGKKSSKSNRSGKRNILKPSSNQDVLASIERNILSAGVEEVVVSRSANERNILSAGVEEVVVSRSANERNILSAGVEETNAQADNSGSLDDVEKIRIAEAAIKIQAACKGYQARWAFQTLKGFAQLQALIRGDLVRRQAVSTLNCVKAIVKVQALVRGHNVRHSDIGIAVLKICKDTKYSDSTGAVATTQPEKLSTNVFVNKLLASSSLTNSLHLNFDPGESNFAWKWLERWTSSNFWKPLPKSKKKLDLKSNEKSPSSQTFENNKGKVKRNVQKTSGVKVDDGSTSDSSKLEHLKKVSSHPMHSSQEHCQKETKNNTKKTSTQSVSSRSEVATEKKKPITGKLLGQAVTDVSENGASVSAGKMKTLGVSQSKQFDVEKSLGHQAKDEHDELLNNPIADLKTSVKNGREIIQGANEDLNSNVNSQNSLRRASLPANFNNQDNNTSHNSPRLPSYMAPTESAKAKLRAQGSPRFAGDLVDKNGITRRHSLSSSLNSRLGSFSPRAERLLTTTSRGVIRTDRSLSLLRDGTVSEKLIQPRWRR